jgi:hypothetical protein
MLEFLRERASDRKLRLFAVVCCRRIRFTFLDRADVEFRLGIAERYADGKASEHDRVRAAAARLGGPPFGSFGCEAAYLDSQDAAVEALNTCDAANRRGLTRRRPPTPRLFGWMRKFFGGSSSPPQPIETPPEYYAERISQCNLLRDIFGNPFRPAAIAPAWRTETVLALARGIYEERAFDRMPILADALQDAGCEDEDVLNHSRRPGPHFRGCWVVDLVLGKS